MSSSSPPSVPSLALCLALALLFSPALAPPSDASSAAEAYADYQRLLEWHTSTTPVAVPDAGIVWRRDTASWALESGQLWTLPPTSDGLVSGFWFEGRGHFEMTVPDPVEADNLERQLDQRGARQLDVTFTKALLRTSESLVTEWIALPQGLTYGPHKEFGKRHQLSLVKRFRDLDARVVAGLQIPDDRFLYIEMDTEELGWLTYEWDDLRREEIRLTKFERNYYNEIWLSLEPPEERLADGRPRGDRGAMLDIHHVDLTVDLAGERRSVRVGLSGLNVVVAEIVAEIHLAPLVSGAKALPLALSSAAEVRSVKDESGAEQLFLRDHIGGRSTDLDKRVYDGSLVVLLDDPLVEGQERRLQVHYKLDVGNFLPGRSWYPNLPDNLNNLHTARITVRAPKKHEVRAIGKQVEESTRDDVTTSVWVMEKPTKMCSLTYGSRFKEEVLEVEGVPTVVSFGPQVSGGFGSKMIKNVGADVVNSLRFFQWLFDDQLPTEKVQLTGINAGHGQAFEGFIHMSEFTYRAESPGASELFRAHETAHQWWGHRIGWHSYRDQWLSESFAEYAAMMFVQATLKNGDKLFEEILQTYTRLLMGSLKGAFSKFARPGLIDVDLSHQRRMGPIGLGYRASNAAMPQGYVIQAYYKGPLVLHMLRKILQAKSQGKDDLFLAALRDFVRQNQGKNASTADFQAVLERQTGMDWGFFFDQWIYGTAIPTYVWSYHIAQQPDAEGHFLVDLKIEQRDAPAGFHMPLPVVFRLADGRSGTFLVEVSAEQDSFQIPLPIRPAKLELAPDFAVLARIKKR